MKRAVLFVSIFLLIPQVAYANDIQVITNGNSSTTVSSQTSGTTTTCINGNCTTTGGGGHTTATVNGKTYESDGDLDVNDDGAEVHIKSSTNNNSVSVNGNKSSTSVHVNTDSNDSDNEVSDKNSKITPTIDQQKTASESSKKIAAKIHQNFVQMFFAGITGIFHRLFIAFK